MQSWLELSSKIGQLKNLRFSMFQMRSVLSTFVVQNGIRVLQVKRALDQIKCFYDYEKIWNLIKNFWKTMNQTGDMSLGGKTKLRFKKVVKTQI